MASSIDASIPICPLYISGVDSSNSKKNVYSAQLWISLKSRMPIKNRAGKALRQTFSPSMIRCLGDTFSLPVRYKRCQYGTEHENIVFELEDMVHVCGTRERREYNKVHKNITIVVELPRCPTTKWAEQLVSSSDETLELRPTTDEICRKCSQFRILGIGKTGVGKSSPINHAFGVQNATASHNNPGEASIDHEFISPQNDRFVLHDSKGFEPAEKDNLNVVRDFIDRRRAMPDLKAWFRRTLRRWGFRDQCKAIYHIEARRRAGNSPIVVVFTKYDTLRGANSGQVLSQGFEQEGHR
jgi:GTP-binding protein EngB required for normal cell division